MKSDELLTNVINKREKVSSLSWGTGAGAAVSAPGVAVLGISVTFRRERVVQLSAQGPCPRLKGFGRQRRRGFLALRLSLCWSVSSLCRAGRPHPWTSCL